MWDLTTGVLIALIGLGVAVVAAALSLVGGGQRPAADTGKYWLVRMLARHPRLAAFVSRRLDRTRAGGMLLTVGFAGVLVLAAIVGLALEMAVAETGVGQWDIAVAEYGARNADRARFDWYAALTHLGGTPGVIAVSGLVGVWGWRRFRTPHVLWFMITVAAGQAILNTGLKELVGRERPDLVQLAPWSGSSFPSGHSAAAAAVFAAAALVLTLDRGRSSRAVVGGVAGLVIGVVAATRALLGVHWLTDVIAGVAVGLAWFLVAAVAFGGRLMRFGEPRDEIAAVSDPSSR